MKGRQRTNITMVVIVLVIFQLVQESNGFELSKDNRLMQMKSQTSNQEMELIVGKGIQLMSQIINLLKRALVLCAMLFLIQNLINFWVLASSYTFLIITIPEYFDSTIFHIYSQYNMSFFQYIGLNVNSSQFGSSNQASSANQNASNYQFNFISFLLEPLLLAALTLIELTILQFIIKKIKIKVRQRRQEYINEAIIIQTSKMAGKVQNQNEDNKQLEPTEKLSVVNQMMRSKKVQNINQIKNQQTFPVKLDKIMTDLTIKAFAFQIRAQLNKGQKKHWSQDIHINKIQKLTALIINYMSGLLLPVYSIVLGNRINKFSQKINLFIYYTLLGFIFIYPIIYCVIALTKKRRDNDKKIKRLKSSDIDSLCQYYLNMCMSVSLGITVSPMPFLIITTIFLSGLLIYSFAQGNNSISLSTCSMSKINKILHKMTFWLYNLCFFVMYGLLTIANKLPNDPKIDNFKIAAYYCSIACLLLFVVGGCHELIEFGINTVITICKLIFMVYEMITKEQYEAVNIEQVQKKSQHKVAKIMENRQEEKFKSKINQTEKVQKQSNIFENMRNSSQKQSQCEQQIIKCQQLVNKILLQQIQSIE